MKVISGAEFGAYWKSLSGRREDESGEKAAKEIIAKVRAEGDSAVRFFASRFDKSSPEVLEVDNARIREALSALAAGEPALASALRFSAENIRRFSLAQKEQFKDFEYENVPGVFTGQKVIPVNRAAVYVPGGRFPLISSALMCLVPAFCAGVPEVCFASPPDGDGLPDRRILAAAGIAAEVCGRLDAGFRAFSIGGAQAVAAFALGTETIPRCDMIAGPGNKYVAAAKRVLYGEAGIDFIAGPSDILVIAEADFSPELAAADMLAQAEHDADARARALVPCEEAAVLLREALENRIQKLPTAKIARASLDAGGLIVIYKDRNEAVKIANTIAPEHLEVHSADPAPWAAGLKNYGSLFLGALSAEVLGDYSAGINHTLPTSGTARFTGGLGVRHFLKTLTTLRCGDKSGYGEALKAAETIALAEGLAGHAESGRKDLRVPGTLR